MRSPTTVPFLPSALAASVLLAIAVIFAACGDGDGAGEATPEATLPGPTATSQVIAPTAEPTEPSATGKIAFTSDRDGNDEIYVMNDDGSGQTNLTNNPAVDSEPAWSPDGSRIAFTSDRDGNFEIYVMNADGSNLTNLTNNSANDGGPAWLADGSKIAFSSARDGLAEIYVMNADGSGQTNLTPSPDGGAYLMDFAWSPDGTRIAVVRTAGAANSTISVVNADGSDGTQLTDLLSLYASPAWSPDGSRIAFGNARASRFNPDTGEFDLGISIPPTIYVVNADGSDLTALTDNPADDADPAWSPDGSRIAFSSLRDDPDPSTCPFSVNTEATRSCNSEIYVMNADGSGQTRLTNNPAMDFDPAWSPAP